MPLATDRPDYQDAVRKIAKQVRRYVEHYWPTMEKRGGVPEEPMNRKERGRGSPAIPGKGFDAMDESEIPSVFRFYVEFFERGDAKSTEGVKFSELLQEARYSPASVGNWLAGETEEMRRMRCAFFEVSRLVAKGVLFVHPDINPDSLWVETGSKGARSRTQAGAQDREAAQTEQRARAMRLRYAQILDVQARHPDASERAVWQMWADEKMLSPSTARDVCRFATKHEWPNGEPVRPEHRWQDDGEAA